jgi:hypothetical protein
MDPADTSWKLSYDRLACGSPSELLERCRKLFNGQVVECYLRQGGVSSYVMKRSDRQVTALRSPPGGTSNLTVTVGISSCPAAMYCSVSACPSDAKQA